MQPPPQAVPPGVVGPPPAGSPPSAFWPGGSYRRQVAAGVPVAPVIHPLQPVTDPFAFSRQAGSPSRSSAPAVPGPAPTAFLQHPGRPVPHANVGDSPPGPSEPLPRPLSQPRPVASPLASALTSSAPPGPETNRGAQDASHAEYEVQAQYLPGAGPDASRGHPHGGLAGPARPPGGQNPQDSAAAPFFSQPGQQAPGPWAPPVQGGPQPAGQLRWHYPEGPAPNAVPLAPGTAHFPAVSSPPQGPAHAQPGASFPGPVARDGREEAVCLQRGSHSGSNFDLEDSFRRDLRVGSAQAGQELRPLPAVPSPFAQGGGPGSQLHYPLGALPGAHPGALAMFFQGGEAENEETLSSENTGSAGRSDGGGFSASPGLGPPPPAPGTAGGAYQALRRAAHSETAQQGGDRRPCFPQPAGPQHDQPAAESAAALRGGTAGTGAPGAGGSHCENVENWELAQNQEVLPSEPLGADAPCSGEQPRYGLLGPAVPRLSVAGHAGEGGSHPEAPDGPPRPARSDSVSSGYGGRGHGSVASAARPQDLGTFIQQEVGKPEDEAPGSFFKQIDSSPVGGEAEEAALSQSGRRSRPPAPSPPKPTGTFQTSANSSFEPVKSHFVGVKPAEAERASVAGEVRGARAQQKCGPAAAPPAACPGNLEQPPDNLETLLPAPAAPPPAFPADASAGPLETAPVTPEKRPSARAQGSVKCESPATTLWAQSELPDFGGNVLLAPAAPALHVPGKPPPPEVVQPPDEGLSGLRCRPPGGLAPLQGGAGVGASENLENPPEMGEEGLLSQAGSGYASLLSSPPAESLQNPPVLIAQPDPSSALAQRPHFPVSSAGPKEKAPSWRDAWGGDRSARSSRAVTGDCGDTGPPSNSLAQSNFPPVAGTSEAGSTQPAHVLLQPPPHPAPKTLLPEGQKGHGAESTPPEVARSPVGGTGTLGAHWSKASPPSHREETPGALDFTLNRTSENPVRMYSPSHPDCPASCRQTMPGRPGQPWHGVHNPDPSCQQVAKGTQDQRGPDRTHQEPARPPPQGSTATTSAPSDPEGPRAQGQPPASPAPADAGQQLQPRPPQASSASVVSSGSGQAAVPPGQPWAQPPPADLASYYYYRPPYDSYQAQYPSAYPPDAGTAPLYYQDIYGLYEPRYRSFDGLAAAYTDSHRYPEPERPSSRASHSSDRPSARQGHPEGYYSSRSGWSSQSDYASYYGGQYDYADPGHWDRYAYGSRLRDGRSYDRRYWYDVEYDPYRKDGCAYADRPERYDDPWRYDPRFAGSFDDDPEPHRDPYGEDLDRHSTHSGHSGHSLRSRHSSFSAHSQQSQVYRGRNVGPCEVPPPPGSFHGDYAYDAYLSSFSGAQGFADYGCAADASWAAVEQVPSRPTSPEKFSVPHVCARFGPGGQLLKVIPNLPSEGQPALVEVHSMETLLQHLPEQEEMRAFPGPLGKDNTHKVDVINFAQSKATQCLQDESLMDRESASLLWSFVVLLCRQNGTVVGTDIAELLLQDHKTVWLPGKSPNEANLIDFSSEALEQAEEEESGEAQLSFLTDSQAAPSPQEKETDRFRELLLYGRKKDALESAMKSGLWGHALLLASKMDSRTHARVMTRFANSLPINDPLQTVYQLMSGRMPAASTCCGDEKWGDWRPHLAMVLSNLSGSLDVESRTMATMGDTLASRGLLEAAHFCYLMAQVGFGVYTKKTAKLVLIGANHSLPFSKFASNEAIQRTEAYEYAQSLGAQSGLLPNFQVFKFIYSCRLADMGLATQAFHYCEVVARSVLLQPHCHSPVLISQLVQIASRLRLFDPQLKEKPEEESFVEPAWLVRLQRVDKQVKEGAAVCIQDAALPQHCAGVPGSEVGQPDGPGLARPLALGPENPLLVPPVPGTEPSGQAVWLLPSAPPALPDGRPASPARVPMFPVPPLGPVEPGPGCGAPGPDAAALHPGLGLPPGTPSLQETEHPLQGAGTQDRGVAPQDPRRRSSLAERRDEAPGGGPESMGSSRTPQDSEASPGWWGASPGTLQPPSLTPAPEAQSPVQTAKKETREPKKSGESWFSRWLPGKKKTEAHLPDDKNKSIVWDEQKQRWVDISEPEEEKRAPPPPPMSFPKAPQASAPGPGGPPRASVNVFSRKAGGARARYVDILNPGRTQRTDPALAPADLFAPLAPLPIPAHLSGPNPDAAGAPPAEGPGREEQAPAGGPAHAEPSSEPQQVLSSRAAFPASELAPYPVDSPQAGELSRCSSMSSLSREVSQHLEQAPGDQLGAGGAPAAAVPFYNPAQFAQTSAASGGSGCGRVSQRKYPALR